MMLTLPKDTVSHMRGHCGASWRPSRRSKSKTFALSIRGVSELFLRLFALAQKGRLFEPQVLASATPLSLWRAQLCHVDVATCAINCHSPHPGRWSSSSPPEPEPCHVTGSITPTRRRTLGVSEDAQCARRHVGWARVGSEGKAGGLGVCRV